VHSRDRVDESVYIPAGGLDIGGGGIIFDTGRGYKADEVKET
jgi:hypothetical protein